MPELRNNDPLEEFKDTINKNSKDHTYEFDPEDIRRNSALAAACYIPILFILPFFLRPDSRFAKFHVNQGILVLILDVVLGAAGKCVSFIPVFPFIFSAATGIITFAYFLYGFINALNGKAKEVPFFGGIRLIKY